MHKWSVYKEFDQAAKAAAEFLAEKIEEKLQQNGVCHVALPGGNTPASCLAYLAGKTLDWGKVHWYLGDERCYPQGHVERNDVMLQKNLWSKIPGTVIHRMPAELGPEQAAEKYRELIDSIECIDIAFLGMGEDGHTASLFPGNAALSDARSVVPVYNSPKAPDERISLSVNTLQNATIRMVLTAGLSKANIIASIKKGEDLPINAIGDIYWFVDEAAVSGSS